MKYSYMLLSQFYCYVLYRILCEWCLWQFCITHIGCENMKYMNNYYICLFHFYNGLVRDWSTIINDLDIGQKLSYGKFYLFFIWCHKTIFLPPIFSSSFDSSTAKNLEVKSFKTLVNTIDMHCLKHKVKLH